MILTLITDCRRACPDARTEQAVVAGALRWLGAAIEAGVDVIQIREHAMAAASVRDITAGVVAQSRGTRTRVIVNDRADVAVAALADGVHLRDDGWPVSRVRRLPRGRSWIVGRSIHAVAPSSSDLAGLDYVTFGAVFGSGTKPARGVDALRSVAAACAVPVVAVGGITPANAAACRDAGAAGVAAISLFLPPGCAPDALGPRDAVSRLRALDGFSCTVEPRPHE